MHVWDAAGTGSIHFNCHEVHQPSLGYIVENSVVTSSLLQSLKACEQVDLLCPVKVTGLSAMPPGHRDRAP